MGVRLVPHRSRSMDEIAFEPLRGETGGTIAWRRADVRTAGSAGGVKVAARRGQVPERCRHGDRVHRTQQGAALRAGEPLRSRMAPLPIGSLLCCAGRSISRSRIVARQARSTRAA